MHSSFRVAGAAFILCSFIYLEMFVLRRDNQALNTPQSFQTSQLQQEHAEVASQPCVPLTLQEKMEDIAEKIDHLRFTMDAGRKEEFNNTSDVRRIMRHELSLLEEDLGIKKWRLNISRELSRTIVKTLDKLQNPKNCDEAQKLYCMIPSGYGFGAGIQDLLWCSFNAYIKRRMLVLFVEKWEYAPKGWDVFFKPISNTCPNSTKHTNEKIFWEGWGNRTLLTSLPSDLAEKLRFLGSNPLPWWYGQLLGYYLKSSISLDEYIERKIQDMNYRNPIVGIHIRRTDKIGKEGHFHSVDEYMVQVENYFKALTLTGVKLDEKRVYVSTDDPKALEECVERYPDYRFIYNPTSASKAENLTTRYKYDAVMEAMLDIHLLAKSNFFVGTFSSGFSRLAYILMQYYNEGALENVYSLDVEFHYVGALNAPRLVVYDHVPERPKDLAVSKGDVMLQPYIHSFQDDSINGKIRDGHSWGRTHRAELQGNYPLYKTKSVFNIVNVTES